MTTAAHRALEASGAARPAQASLAVEEVYRCHYGYVFRALRGLGVNDSHVDDALQEVFLVVHGRLGEFDGRAKLTTWLYAIAFNVARTYRRKYARDAPMEDRESASADSGSNPERATEQREAAALADRLLNCLTEEKREVFVMIEMHQLSAPEVARITGTNVHTVSSRLAAARQEFRAAFRRHQTLRAGEDR